MPPRGGKWKEEDVSGGLPPATLGFSPFVALVDGLLGVEATATLKRITSRLATKWKQPYSKTCGYVKSRVAITLVRTTHRCIRGSRVHAHWISVQRPQWEDGAGINLFW